MLIKNAGIQNLAAALEHIDRDTRERVLAVNLNGQYLGVKTVAPSMRRAGGGAIVNVGHVPRRHCHVRPVRCQRMGCPRPGQRCRPRALFAMPPPGRAREIAKLVLFLCSDDAAFATGANCIFGGGLLPGPAAALDRRLTLTCRR